MKKLFSILFCLNVLMAQSSFVGEQFERGSINYSNRTIQAIGIGFIPENVINAGQARRAALRIAKQDALRQLIEIVNGVVVTSETTMSNAMFDDVIKSRVQGATTRSSRRCLSNNPFSAARPRSGGAPNDPTLAITPSHF